MARLEVELDQLVDRLLEVQAGLYGQVDGTPEGDHVGLGLVNDGGAGGRSGLVLTHVIPVCPILVKNLRHDSFNKGGYCLYYQFLSQYPRLGPVKGFLRILGCP